MVTISSTRYQKLLSVMDGFFPCLPNLLLDGNSSPVTKETYGHLHSQDNGILFFRQKGYKIKTGNLTRT